MRGLHMKSKKIELHTELENKLKKLDVTLSTMKVISTIAYVNLAVYIVTTITLLTSFKNEHYVLLLNIKFSSILSFIILMILNALLNYLVVPYFSRL